MNYLLCVLFFLLWLPLSASAGQCSMLILGDSLSSGFGLKSGTGWVDLLDARLKIISPKWQVINASISGDTTQSGLQRLQPALVRNRPQAVLIELGGNDALRGIPPATIRLNLVNMIRQAKAAGAWIALLEAPILPNYGKAYAEAMSKVYGEVARQEKITLVPCFVCGVGVDPKLMQDDRIHPNEKAQARILDAVWQHIKPGLPKCPVTQ